MRIVELLRTAICATAALAVVGCTESVFLTLEDFTEEGLALMTFPAPTDEMAVLRSTYIAGGVGLYAVHAIENYSAASTVGDAERVVARLDTIRDQLVDQRRDAANPAASTSGDRIRHYDRLAYVVDAFGLIEAATGPARRYYRERAIGLIASRDPVGAAKTAFTALRAIVKIEIYRGALLHDARVHAIGIGSRVKQNDPADAQRRLANPAADACASEALLLDAARWRKLTAGGVTARAARADWLDFVGESIRQKLCSGEGKFSTGEWSLLLVAARMPDHWTGAPTTLSADDWTRAGDHLAEACRRLHQLSKRAEDKRPAWCAPGGAVFPAT